MEDIGKDHTDKDSVYKGQKLTVDSIMKFLTVFMILFLTYIVVAHITAGKYDIDDMVIVVSFIFLLLTLKWMIKEAWV